MVVVSVVLGCVMAVGGFVHVLVVVVVAIFVAVASVVAHVSTVYH